MSLKLEDWLNKVQAARSRQEIFKILDEFRKLAWTDVERAAMGKLYIRALDNMDEEDTTSTSEDQQASSGDEEVWYEKM